MNSNSSPPWCSLSCLFLVLPAKDTEHIFLLATAIYIFEDLHITCSPLSPSGFPRFFRPLWQVMFWRSLSLFSSRLFPNCSLQIQTSLHLRPSLPDFVYLADWNAVYTSEFASFLPQQHTGTYPEKLSIMKKLISLLQIQRLLQRMFLKSYLAKAVQISLQEKTPLAREGVWEEWHH